VRILVWNLLHGGGGRLERLAAAIAAHDADLCILAESRTGPDLRLRQLLEPHGYVHNASTLAADGKNGVMALARIPFTAGPVPPDELSAQRWLTLRLPEVELVACHVPPKISVGVERKLAFWQTLLEYAESAVAERAIIVGDLNTGAPYRDEHRATLYCAEQFQQLARIGWIDAWRRFHGPARKEWSWAYPRRPGYGYRLDHAFCSPPLADDLRGCRYSHEERKAGISDHSVLLVELAGG
jgi:exodeoxyribonuclease-3